MDFREVLSQHPHCWHYPFFSLTLARFAAQLSALAYRTPAEIDTQLTEAGMTVEHFQAGGASAYIAYNDYAGWLVWRGTDLLDMQDHLANADVRKTLCPHLRMQVHGGFKGYVDQLWPQIIKSLGRLRETNILRVWYGAGHSLGAAATILSLPRFRAFSKGYVFGAPRVLGRDSEYQYPDWLTIYRISARGDIVTKLPSLFRWEHTFPLWVLDDRNQLSLAQRSAYSYWISGVNLADSFRQGRLLSSLISDVAFKTHSIEQRYLKGLFSATL